MSSDYLIMLVMGKRWPPLTLPWVVSLFGLNICLCFLSIRMLRQGAKKVIFTAYHSGKLKPAYTSLNVISASPKNVLMSRIDFTVLL